MCFNRKLGIYLRLPYSESLIQKMELFLAGKQEYTELSRKRLQHRCFPVKLAKLFRTTFLKNISG